MTISPAPDGASVATVFAVDDDPLLLKLLSHLLQAQGHRAEMFSAAPELLEALADITPDLIISDLNMPGMDGMALLAEINRRGLPVPVVMLTGTSDLHIALAAMHAGAADYLTKPIEAGRFEEMLARVLRLARLERDNQRHLRELRRRDELMQQEMRTARTVHRNYLPEEVPEFSGFTFGMTLIPSLAIGGDIIDFYPAPGDPGRLGIIFADISGHGVGAALLSMLFKTIAAQIFRVAESPAAGMAELNRRLEADFPPGQFACTTYLELRPGSRSVRFVRGSQEPLLHIRADGGLSEYTEGGTPPGMFNTGRYSDIGYRDQELTMAPGDTLLLYTDGVSEAVNPEKQMLGPEKMQAWLVADRALPPQELTERLYQRVVGFTHTRQLEDDLTVFAIRAD